jgi:hypothetical protein
MSFFKFQELLNGNVYTYYFPVPTGGETLSMNMFEEIIKNHPNYKLLKHSVDEHSVDTYAKYDPENIKLVKPLRFSTIMKDIESTHSIDSVLYNGMFTFYSF